MGGQRGGMTNELDEFPSVCNKSIQAQSTDIQPPIPEEIFQHRLNDFKALSSREMETLGRLDTPIHKARDSDQFVPVSWDWALKHAASRFRAAQPDQTFFYSSGRSSNEAGFILQLLARLYGTNNVNNCSYYCHQATGVGLGNSIGTGTATIELADLSGCDLIFVIGANPASNHPRFVHQLKNCRERGGQVIVVNPAREPGLIRFAVPKSAKSLISGGSWIASEYLQPIIGSDYLLMLAIGKAVLNKQAAEMEFINQYTEGFAAYREQLESTSWDLLCRETGINRQDIERSAEVYSQSKSCVFAWGMGITHHIHGVENVEAIANLALLRGMMGRPHAGLLPLRGHSNVQGIGTIGVKPVLTKEVFERMETELGIVLPKTKGLDTLACLKKANEGKMEAALLMGGNLYEASPDSGWTQQALDHIPFKLYLTTTLNRGHVHGIEHSEALILPVTARDEEWEPTTQESMFNYLRLSDGGITRLSNVRPESHILSELAKEVLPDSPVDFDEFRHHQTIRQAIARIIPGMEPLADIDIAKTEFHIRNRLLHKPVFHTPSGKARFITHPLKPSNSDPEFTFTLMSVRSEGQFNSIVYEENDSYRGTEHRWVVFMSPGDIKRLGVAAGDRVTLCSPHGEMSGVQVIEFSLPAGNLMAYFPEANRLIGLDSDPRSHTPAFKSVPVSINQLF